jgi:hypothetical protein
MTMSTSTFLRRQAEHCIALSRSTFDLTLAGRLRAMAEELRAKAMEWDDSPVPEHLNGGNSFHPTA